MNTARWTAAGAMGWTATRRPSEPWFGTSSFGGGGVYNVLDLGDTVCRESAAGRVFADQIFVRSDIYAVDLIGRDIALDPLDLRPELLQDAARRLRYRLQLGRGRVAHT